MQRSFKMKKPLKSILASLAEPGPTIQVLEEPEDDTAAKVVESDEEFALGGQPARKSDWDAGEDTRYKGKKTSRRKIQDASDEEPSGDDDGVEDEYIDSDAVEEVSDSEEETERSDGGSDDEEEFRSGEHFEKESAEKDSEDVEADDDKDSVTKRVVKPESVSESGGEEDSDEAEDDFDDGEDLLAFQGEEEESDSGEKPKVFSQRLSQSQSSEIRKGLAVKHQIEEWDAFLQWRIHMQKLLHSVNQAPDWRTHGDFVEVGDKSFQSSLAAAKKSVKQLLVSLINAREELSRTNEKALGPDEKSLLDDDEEIHSSEASGYDESDCSEVESPKSKKLTKKPSAPPRSRAAIAKPSMSLQELERIRRQSFASSRAYRESVVQEWSDKTKLLARTGKHDKGFAAFDQSTLQQINHIMADKARLVKRTRIQRSVYQILGKRKTPAKEADDAVVPPEEPENLNPEIFDDDDFYQNLLREFIAKKMSVDGSTNLVGQQWLEMQNLRKKLKKRRMDRESKGRRLKYEVHPKMVSFMAPKLPPIDSLSDAARNELFSCLFGKNTLPQTHLVQGSEAA